MWLSTGRDQATVINRLIEEGFTTKTGIPVNLQLVSGALLKATIAGQGPDVNLFTGRGEVMNLAFRGALADLSPPCGTAHRFPTPSVRVCTAWRRVRTSW